MSCRTTLLVALLLLLAAPGAFAQHEFEITPFGGYKFGGKIDLPPDASPTYDYLPIKSSVDYGLDVDYSIWPNFQGEFQFNHQPTDIDAHAFATDSQFFLTSAAVNMYQFGFAYNFKPTDAKLKPFFGAGLGFTQWKPSAILPFSHTFSYNIGGGVKYFFSSHVGLRLEARWSPSRTTSQNEQFCDPFYGFCGTQTVASHAEQGQVNVGLIFRFKQNYGSY